MLAYHYRLVIDQRLRLLGMVEAMQLEPVLARWRATRDPQLSTWVMKLGGDPDPGIAAAYAALKPTARAAALCDELGKVTAPRLASLLPVIDRTVRTVRGSWPVVELFAELPPDPRFAELALGLLADFGTLPHTSAKLWRRLLDAVEHHGDPSCIARLQQIQPRDPDSARITNIAKRLARAAVLTADQLAALSAEQAPPPPSTNGPELLAAIYADPSSDGARTIYGDWLTLHEDPRGEFIQLQLQRAAGTLTPAGERRETALLKKHAKAWLGPLASVISIPVWAPTYAPLPTELCVPHESLRNVSFARGFIRHLPELEVPMLRRAVYDDPIWSTVEHVARVPAVTPAMRALHTIDQGDATVLASGRTFSFVGLEGDAFATIVACPVRHLSVDLDYRNTALVPSQLANAARDNATLTAFTLSRIEPRAWRDLWRVLSLELPHLSRITFVLDPGQLELEPEARVLAIEPAGGDVQHWEWIFSSLEPRTFEHIEIRPGYAAALVERVVRAYELAPAIVRL